MRAQEGVVVGPEPLRPTASGAAPPPATPVFVEPAFLSVEEKLSVSLSKEGAVENLEVQVSDAANQYMKI